MNENWLFKFLKKNLTILLNHRKLKINFLLYSHIHVKTVLTLIRLLLNSLLWTDHSVIVFFSGFKVMNNEDLCFTQS